MFISFSTLFFLTNCLPLIAHVYPYTSKLGYLFICLCLGVLAISMLLHVDFAGIMSIVLCNWMLDLKSNIMLLHYLYG